jgi:hypothetical protein
MKLLDITGLRFDEATGHYSSREGRKMDKDMKIKIQQLIWTQQKFSTRGFTWKKWRAI